MTKLTMEVDEGVAKRLADAAADRGVAPETVAAEAVTEKFPLRRKLGFVSLGRSRSGRRAAEDEDSWLKASAAEPARRHQRHRRRRR